MFEELVNKLMQGMPENRRWALKLWMFGMLPILCIAVGVLGLTARARGVEWGILGSFFIVTGIQIVLWFLGIRMELFGTATDEDFTLWGTKSAPLTGDTVFWEVKAGSQQYDQMRKQILQIPSYEHALQAFQLGRGRIESLPQEEWDTLDALVISNFISTYETRVAKSGEKETERFYGLIKEIHELHERLRQQEIQEIQERQERQRQQGR